MVYNFFKKLLVAIQKTNKTGRKTKKKLEERDFLLRGNFRGGFCLGGRWF